MRAIPRKHGRSADRSRSKSFKRTMHFELLEGRALLAGDLELMLDIATADSPLNSNPRSFSSIGSKVYFTATTPVFGEELWVTDGTAAGTQMVRDIFPGSTSSSPRNFLNFNDVLFFTANNGANGEELWKSDGTPEGTTIVKDINPGAVSGASTSLALFQGKIFLAANDGVSGSELWQSDGTLAGTSRVADVQPGTIGSSPSGLTAVGPELFFVASTTTSGSELWASDGTAAGTRLVMDIQSGTPSGSPGNLTNIGGLLYFSAATTATGFEPWTSDGTTAGTQMLMDIDVGTGSSRPSNFFNFGGQALFAARAGEGVELWSSNGTTAGTSLLKDINPGASNSNPAEFTLVNGKVYFRATDAATGGELWSTDGTTAGTALVKDLVPGPSSGFLFNLVNVNGTLHFSNSFNNTLWKSDGTSEGTVNLPLPSAISNFVASNGILYFAGKDAVGDTELWRSDTTSAGTFLLKNINNENQSSDPSQFTNVNGRMFFTATSTSFGNELWSTDGTAAGTAMVKDIGPGPLSAGINSMVSFNGLLYFVISGALWRSDGTDAGTFPVVGQPGSPILFVFGPTVVGDKLYFSAAKNDATTGVELFKSDGTLAGTTLVKDIRPGLADSNPFFLTNVNGTLFFSATDGVGSELWKSDGTTAGTVLVKDIAAGSESSGPLSLTNVNGILYMRAFTSANGFELWRSNGTSAGTFLVKDIFPGPASSSISSMVNVNGKLMFNASDNVNGGELWVSDGTSAGTFMVRDIAPGNQSSVTIIGSIGSTAYFYANDGIVGSELWQSDGTTAGTNLLKDIFPGPGSSFVSSIAARSIATTSALGNQIYFPANDGVHGQEIWRTDGTSINTTLIDDITGDSGGSRPSSIAFINGRLFVAAGRGDVGVELFSRAPMSPPSSISISNDALIESAIVGTEVGILSSVDADAGDSWSYSLVPGIGATDNSFFSIVGDRLILTSLPSNFGKEASYSVRVRSVDSEGNFAEQPLEIQVDSVAPTLTVTGPGSISNPVSGQEVFFTANVSDPGNGTGPYSVRIDWDADGLWDETVTGSAPLLIPHRFDLAGSYSPRFQAVDPESIVDSGVEIVGPISVSNWAVQGNTFAVGGSDGGSEDDVIQVDPAVTAGQFIVSVNGVNIQTPPATTFSLASLVVTQLKVFSGGGVDRLVLRGNSAANLMIANGVSRTLTLDLATDLVVLGDSSVEQLAVDGLSGNDSFTINGDVEAVGGLGNDLFEIQDGSQANVSTIVRGDAGADVLSYSLWTTPLDMTLTSTALGNGTSTGSLQFSGVETYRGTNQLDTLRGPTITSTWTITGQEAGTINGRIFQQFDSLIGSSAVDSFRFTTALSRIGSIDGVSGNDTVSVIIPGQNIEWELSGADSGEVRNLLSSDVIAQISRVRNWTGNNAQKDVLIVDAAGTLAGRFTAGTGAPIDELDYHLVPGATVNLQTSTSSGIASIIGFESFVGDDSTATLVGKSAAATWDIAGPNTGTLLQTTSIAFQGFANLIGGSLDDTFLMGQLGSISGSIQAGNGLNALSYATRTTPVSVNLSLSTPTATDIGGLTDSFSLLLGGDADDVLVGSNLRSMVLIGNGGNDSLTGGAQRDILFGGTGTDVLQGGSSDDLLFGARTPFDGDLVGLKRLRQEWISTRTYTARIANLQGSTTGGLNGTYLLTNNPPDRLLDDGEVDSLFGQLGRDWFIWDASDAALIDQALDEVVSPA